jgi:hypothetical protein
MIIMRPDFEQFRGTRNDPKELVAARLPAELKEKLDIISATEGDSITGLLIEGAARVVLDRESDPVYVLNAQATLERQAADLEARLEQTRAMLGRISND